jgi:hypothetical protein
VTDEQERRLARAIAGALRGAIRDHGAVTPEWIGSATKRILGNIRNAHLDGVDSRGAATPPRGDQTGRACQAADVPLTPGAAVLA